MAVADDMYVYLRSEYAGTADEDETNVGALLALWRADAGLEEWEDYVAHIHDLAVLGGVDGGTFADESARVWSSLAASV